MQTFNHKLKTFVPILIIAVCTCYLLIKCINENINQEETFKKLKFKFLTSILKSKSDKFDYQYDGLSPQESNFVDCKLKYLILKSNGDLSDTENLVEFENDSISKIIVRKTIFEQNGNKAGRNWENIEIDSVFVLDYKTNKKEIYKNKTLLKSLPMKDIDENTQYIYQVKKQTEKNYTCK